MQDRFHFRSGPRGGGTTANHTPAGAKGGGTTASRLLPPSASGRVVRIRQRFAVPPPRPLLDAIAGPHHSGKRGNGTPTGRGGSDDGEKGGYFFPKWDPADTLYAIPPAVAEARGAVWAGRTVPAKRTRKGGRGGQGREGKGASSAAPITRTVHEGSQALPRLGFPVQGGLGTTATGMPAQSTRGPKPYRAWYAPYSPPGGLGTTAPAMPRTVHQRAQARPRLGCPVQSTRGPRHHRA